MPIETLGNAQYKDLGETWYSHQAARIVQRHIQFGRHCRLDLDALLAGTARRIRGTNLDSAWALRATDSAADPFAVLRSPDSLVASLRRVMRGADVVLVNAEGAIGDDLLTKIRSIDGIRASPEKLRGCITQSELPHFLG